MVERAAPRALFLIGPPGSGKTTVSAMLSEKLGYRVIHGGALLRRLAGEAQTSKAAIIAQQILSTGRPIPVPLYCTMVADALKGSDAPSVLFDGYPRSVRQCHAIPLVLMTARLWSANEIIICLDLSNTEAAERITNRRHCNNCGANWEKSRLTQCCAGPSIARRQDDHGALSATRLSDYRARLPKIKRALQARGRPPVVVSASTTAERVVESILHILHEARR